ncbi:MAG TPA: LLM class flavin-dependent oxidoreductase [Acidimicrobiales bacterium]
MRLGVSVRSAYAVEDSRQAARWMIERASAAASAGLDSLFVGDHHATGVAYQQNSPILGRLLAEWDDRPAGALYLLPFWHPVLLAEQVGTLASIAQGPFILQCALGGGPDPVHPYEGQFAAMGVDRRRRVVAFERTLRHLRALIDGGAVTDDEPYPMRDVRAGPAAPGPIDVWIGAEVPAAIDRAARLGDAWICGPAVPVDQAVADLDHYRQRCVAHGTMPHAVIRRDVHVGADDADADRVAGPVLERGYRGFADGVCITGGPDTVSARLAPLAEAGFAEVLVRHLVDDQSEVLASFERLGRVHDAVALL